MKYHTIIICLLIAAGCGRESPHIRELRTKVANVGADTLLGDAKTLSQEYTYTKSNDRNGWRVDPTNSLSVFGRPVRVRSNSVFITTAGLGSFRAGVLINTSGAEMNIESNYLLLASNIWFVSGRQ
jgi:hypothetical protein